MNHFSSRLFVQSFCTLHLPRLRDLCFDLETCSVLLCAFIQACPRSTLSLKFVAVSVDHSSIVCSYGGTTFVVRRSPIRRKSISRHIVVISSSYRRHIAISSSYRHIAISSDPLASFVVSDVHQKNVSFVVRASVVISSSYRRRWSEPPSSFIVFKLSQAFAMMLFRSQSVGWASRCFVSIAHSPTCSFQAF